MLYQPSSRLIGRTSTVCVALSKGPPIRPIRSTERMSGVRGACGRRWLRTHCVHSRSAHIATACAAQPVTSRASSSSIERVPLRRR